MIVGRDFVFFVLIGFVLNTEIKLVVIMTNATKEL
jgi:hypothetical protein